MNGSQRLALCLLLAAALHLVGGEGEADAAPAAMPPMQQDLSFDGYLNCSDKHWFRPQAVTQPAQCDRISSCVPYDTAGKVPYEAYTFDVNLVADPDDPSTWWVFQTCNGPVHDTIIAVYEGKLNPDAPCGDAGAQHRPLVAYNDDSSVCGHRAQSYLEFAPCSTGLHTVVVTSYGNFAPDYGMYDLRVHVPPGETFEDTRCPDCSLFVNPTPWNLQALPMKEAVDPRWVYNQASVWIPERETCFSDWLASPVGLTDWTGPAFMEAGWLITAEKYRYSLPEMMCVDRFCAYASWQGGASGPGLTIRQSNWQPGQRPWFRVRFAGHDPSYDTSWFEAQWLHWGPWSTLGRSAFHDLGFRWLGAGNEMSSVFAPNGHPARIKGDENSNRFENNAALDADDLRGLRPTPTPRPWCWETIQGRHSDLADVSPDPCENGTEGWVIDLPPVPTPTP